MRSMIEGIYVTTLLAGPLTLIGLLIATGAYVSKPSRWRRRVAVSIAGLAVVGYIVALTYIVLPANYLVDDPNRGLEQPTLALHVDELGAARQFPDSDPRRQTVERRVMNERLEFVAAWFGLSFVATATVCVGDYVVLKLQQHKRATHMT